MRTRLRIDGQVDTLERSLSEDVRPLDVPAIGAAQRRRAGLRNAQRFARSPEPARTHSHRAGPARTHLISTASAYLAPWSSRWCLCCEGSERSLNRQLGHRHHVHPDAPCAFRRRPSPWLPLRQARISSGNGPMAAAGAGCATWRDLQRVLGHFPVLRRAGTQGRLSRWLPGSPPEQRNATRALRRAAQCKRCAIERASEWRCARAAQGHALTAQTTPAPATKAALVRSLGRSFNRNL